MQFKQGTAVWTADDRKVGEVERVVIDPRTDEVTHLVVEKGFLLPVDKVVPISLIGPATEDRVRLREDAGDLEKLPDFEETHYIPLVEAESREAPPKPYASPLHWYPAIGTTWWQSGGHVGYPGFSNYPMPPYVVETERNVPEGAVALKEGAKVVDKDGDSVGDVEAVLTDPEDDRVTHLVVTQGLLAEEKRLVPTLWVSMARSDQVRLTVDADLVENLPAYEG